MEANLNQFRLLTVIQGEQKAGNDRRRTGGQDAKNGGSPYHPDRPIRPRTDSKGGGGGGGGGTSKGSPFGRDGAGKGSPYDHQSDPCDGQSCELIITTASREERDRETSSASAAAAAAAAAAKEEEGGKREGSGEVDSVSTASHQGDDPGPTHRGRVLSSVDRDESRNSSRLGLGVAMVRSKNDEDDDESNADTEAGGAGEMSLVEALRCLERTMNNHCQLLTKKLKRERTVQTPSSGGARAAVPVMPKTTAIRTDKVTVYIRVVFLKIGEIDTMKENFMADAFIQARWREPALDGQAMQFQSLQNIEDMDWDKFWNPKLYVENNLGEPKETVWQTLMYNAKGDATVYERRRIKGCFLENLELDEFPFDTQDLTLTISTERSETELELEEDSSEISSINVQSFVDEQEWKLHSHVETHRRVTTKIYQNSKFKHPAFSTSCRASRRPGFFIWNIFLVMLFICSLTFATFSVELTKPENRLQLSFILLLTTITFKFVVSQTLPRISYLTYLDKYILTSMGILCGVCVWHAIVPQLVKSYDKVAKKIDMWALILSGSSYFLFHVCFFMYIYFVAMKKRWTYDQKDREHRERVKKLQRLQELNTTANSDATSGQATTGYETV